MRISAAFVEKAFHVFVHVSTLEKRPGEDGGEFILDGPHLRLRGYQPRRRLRSGMHCNSGDNRAQCRPAAACFQAARAKLEGRRKANVRILRAPVSSGQKGRDTPVGIFCVIQKEMVGDAPTRPCGMTLAEFEKFVVDETAKWANVIRAANSRRNRARRCRRDIPYFPIREPTLHHNNALRAGGLLQCINLRSGESATGQSRRRSHVTRPPLIRKRT
jgi:hypothetical protein